MLISLEKVQKLWNGWEIRILVLISLTLQIILILSGSRRKYIVRGSIQILIWLSYIAADWVATVALSHLATSQNDFEENNSPNLSYQLQSFWAPFLLLHLGGPGTITAYSLQDNELWPRHLLGLLVQVGIAFYVFVRSWSNTGLTYLAIPMFISGIIKYGERIWVLWSSSNEQFRDKLIVTHDSPLDLVRWAQEKTEVQKDESNHPLIVAFSLFKSSTHLFAGLTLNKDERKKSNDIFLRKSAARVFNLIAIELAFMYDLLYTKATIIYSRSGIVLRFVSFLSSVSAIVVFSIIDHRPYSPIDLFITHVLFFGAVSLEIYAAIQNILSDWTRLIYLIRRKPVVYPLISYRVWQKRWSESMGQFNLISFSLRKNSTSYLGVHKLLAFNKLLDCYQCLTRAKIDDQLQEVIFYYVLQKMEMLENLTGFSGLSGELRKKLKTLPDDDVRGKIDSQFGYRDMLIIWHIVTDICYWEDPDKREGELYCRISRQLADYMLYLLVFCPSMMPKEIGEYRFKVTCDSIMSILKSERISSKNLKVNACKLLGKKLRSSHDEQLNDKDLLKGVAIVEGAIQNLEYEKKWEMLAEYWMDTLIYVAGNCEWKEHGQQLKNGGELLTHVSLLLAHLGFSENYQDSGSNIP